MSKFIITGGKKLAGEIEVYGAKNAALKMIAASVLIPAKVILENVPDIIDIQHMTDILTESGAEVHRDGHNLTINTTNLSNKNPDQELIRKMRGSIVLIGPYLARFGQIEIIQPGGCVIGTRPIDIHLDAFKQMGAIVTQKNECIYELKAGRLTSPRVTLKGVSVTATENIIMASVLGSGQTILENAACEPEIVDLAQMLNKAGARIVGAGTTTITINAVATLNSVHYRVMPDRIEAGTFIALAVAAKSQLLITHCQPDHLGAFLDKIKEMGAKINIGGSMIQVLPSENLKAVDIKTEVYPGFPTDLQAPMGLLLTQVEGESKITENIFENRLGYLAQLNKMGATTKQLDDHRAVITGPTKLNGAEIEGLDLRAGMTLIMAGLIAEGPTTILNAEIVDRGYEKIEHRLIKIGAQIERTT